MRKQVEESTAAESARRATGAAAERDRRGRFSARRKRATVLRLRRGEDLESVSRELGITAARASQWRDQFLAAGQAGLKSRAPDARDEEHQRLHAKVGELLMENELLDAKVDHLEAGGPLARRRSTRCVAPSRSPPVGRTAYNGSAACGDRATARDAVARLTAPRAGRCRHARCWWPSTRSLTVSWRRVPESVGEAAGRKDPHLAGTGATVDAGARPPGPVPRGSCTRPEGTWWNDHHGSPRRDVGDGHDVHGDGRRGGDLRLRGRRSLYDRVHRSPCGQAGTRFEALEPIRQGVRER